MTILKDGKKVRRSKSTSSDVAESKPVPATSTPEAEEVEVKEKSYLILIERTPEKIILSLKVTDEKNCLSEAEQFIGDKPAFVPSSAAVPFGLTVLFDPNYHQKQLPVTLATSTNLLVHGNCVLCCYDGQNFHGLGPVLVSWALKQFDYILVES